MLTMLTKGPEYSVDAAGDSARAILTLAIGLILGYLTLKSLLSHGKGGDYKKAANVVFASLIAMIPLALSVSVTVAMGYGSALLHFGTDLISR